MNFRLLAGVALVLALVIAPATAKKKKKDEEPVTQTLPVVADPPPAIVTDAESLVFRNAPASGRGLLSQQVRDALKSLIQNSRGATIVKLRAFVAGTGDLRRVQTLVSEVFAEKHLPLPALSTIQGGALPGEGVQVAIESIAAQKRPANPGGVALISGQPGQTVDESVDRIRAAVQSLGAAPGRVAAVTCFVSSLENYESSRKAVAAAFSGAAADFIQMQRVPVTTPIECEAVVSLETAPPVRVALRDPAANYSRAAVIGPGRMVITGLQLGFGTTDRDVRLAFERLARVLEGVQSSFKEVVFAHFYPVSGDAIEKIRATRFQFLDAARPPASTLLPFESMASQEASFGMEVVAAR